MTLTHKLCSFDQGHIKSLKIMSLTRAIILVVPNAFRLEWAVNLLRPTFQICRVSVDANFVPFAAAGTNGKEFKAGRVAFGIAPCELGLIAAEQIRSLVKVSVGGALRLVRVPVDALVVFAAIRGVWERFVPCIRSVRKIRSCLSLRK